MPASLYEPTSSHAVLRESSGDSSRAWEALLVPRRTGKRVDLRQAGWEVCTGVAVEHGPLPYTGTAQGWERGPLSRRCLPWSGWAL